MARSMMRLRTMKVPKAFSKGQSMRVEGEYDTASTSRRKSNNVPQSTLMVHASKKQDAAILYEWSAGFRLIIS